MTLQSNVSKTNDSANNNAKQLEKKQTKQDDVSVCDVMKDNTSKIIKKIEYQIPSYVQEYSDLFSEYLHMFDDLYGTCYISEKEFFDKLGLNHKALKAFDNYFTSMTDNYSTQIEMSTHFMSAYVKMRISAIQSADRYVHVIMDSYAKMLSQFNSITKK